jgi:hypothetical protein
MTVPPESGTSDGGGGMDVTDSGSGDTAILDTGPGACNAPGMTRMQCRMCCAVQDKDGQAALYADLFQCACAPDICGPAADGGGSDAGAADAGGADGGGVGPGDCTATCTTGAPPTGRCLRCGLDSLRADGGACSSTVGPECATNPDCLAYVQCTRSCP